MSYISIDIGTSSCKTAVVDENGGILRQAQGSYEILHPKPGWAELSPDEIWRAVRNALREIAPYCKDAVGLAVSSLGETMVLLDEQGRPLTNGIVYLDNRSVSQFQQVMDEVGIRNMLRLTGTPTNPMYSLYQYLWMRSHRPEILEKTRRIFLVADYVSYMLTGERGIDPSLASRTALFDVQAGDWSEELMRRFGIDRKMFSPVLPAGTPLGRIRQEYAEQLGLPRTLLVRVGCHDQCGANLGGGVAQEGDLVAGQGSTESINLVIRTDHALIREGRLAYEPYVIPGHSFITAGQLAYGTSIRWFAEQIEQELYARCKERGENIYTVLDAMCAESSNGVVFLPNLTSTQFDGRESSLGCFLGLDTGTDHRHLYRAVLEGISFESCAILSQFEELGFKASCIHAVGGVTQSRKLMQIKADIMQKNIHVMREKEAGVLGLAIICAVGEGAYGDYAEAIRRLIREKELFVPERSYEAEYRRYTEFSRLTRKYLAPVR